MTPPRQLHRRGTAGLLAALLLVAGACTGTDPDATDTGSATTRAAPSTTVANTTTTVPLSSTTATTSTTTSATPTTTTTTTTSTVPELDIAGEPMIEFAVEVGDDVDLDRNELAAFVVATLEDPRGWRSRGAGFRLVDDGGLFTLTVAQPDEVDRMCAPLQTNGYFSCARNGYVALNADRWFGAVDDWPSDLITYRRYVVNHEIGHYLLGPGHPGCPGAGEAAPIMMQQTKGLDGCVANGWVDPEGAPPVGETASAE